MKTVAERAGGVRWGRLWLRGALFGACCLVWTGAQAQSLGREIEQKVRAATFEVVIPKPAEDPVVYEKPLPLDLLPYQFRNDKYYSIGTAFALGAHRYVTAAHVLGSGIGSQLGAPAVRDGSGHVYAIKEILKVSSDEDFAVFSLVGDPAVEPLEQGPHPAINDTVYAVGNALGEGVVIRDGLYTSDTPEERDGRWKWLRFSAAASPGNSGGPLLDKDGKVVGIVRAKSANENLNYAVSIDQVTNAKDNVARLDTVVHYHLDIFDTKQTETLKQEIPLPKSLAEFSEAYLKIWNAFDDQALVSCLKSNVN
ncbi:MAG: serine protease [Nevskia sp.]|nr:serine protease [Nevskia sp.]